MKKQNNLFKALTLGAFALLLNACEPAPMLQSGERVASPSAYNMAKMKSKTLYWSSVGNGSKIFRATIDANGVQKLDTLFDETDGIGGVGGLAVDSKNGKLYWTDFINGQIVRGNKDGSGTPEILYDTNDGLVNPTEIALDTYNNRTRMYWSDQDLNQIVRGSEDGLAKPKVLFDATDGVNGAFGITLSVYGGCVYWAEFASGIVRKGRADGNGVPTVLFDKSDGLLEPYDIAIDQARNKLYLIDNPTAEGQQSRILSGSLDGAGTLSLLFDETDNVLNCFAIATDNKDKKVYWLNQFTGVDEEGGKLYRGNTDGSGTAEVVIPKVLEGVNLAIE